MKQSQNYNNSEMYQLIFEMVYKTKFMLEIQERTGTTIDQMCEILKKAKAEAGTV